MDINKIYNENCLTTMGRMPDSFIDLTVTSPPYDDLRDYKGYSFPFEEIAKELFRVTKGGGIVVWIVADATVNGSESLSSFKQAIYFNDVCGFRVHDTMIYQTDKIPTESNRYQQKFEYTFILSKGKPNTFNPIKVNSKTAGKKNTSHTQRKPNGIVKSGREGRSSMYVKDEKIKGNVWEYSVGYMHTTRDKIAYKHPAMFPEKLARDHIYSWSNEGDLIYDPFMGSGTTAKMAHLQKRNWIGSEISKEYVELAYKRIDPYLKQLTIFNSYK